MPAKDSAVKSKTTPAASKADPAPSKAAAAPAKAVAPAKAPAAPVKAPAKTVKISKPLSDNQAVVTRKAPRAAAPTPLLPIAERARLVAEAAYFLAEKRGFEPTGTEADWFEAEAQVDGAYRFT